MAAKKQEEKTEEVDQDEAAAPVVTSVPAPNNSARPNDIPLPNTTFADRAKAAGGNKRVEASESK